MLGNMVSKMKEVQQILEDTKIKMESIYVNAESPDGMIMLVMNANKKIKEIRINENLLKLTEKENLEQKITNCINFAIEKADKIFESEIKGITKGIFPSFPFLF